MLERGTMNGRQKVRLAVEMVLDDGKITRGRLVGKFRTLAENLAADGGFLEIETGDGRLNYISKGAIRKISEISMPVADQLNRKMAAAKVGEAYSILGVSPRYSEEDLMTAYRALSKAYHPDRLSSMELPAEILEYAEAMQRRINAAFEELRGGAKARGPQLATERPAQPQASQPHAQQTAPPQPSAQRSAQHLAQHSAQPRPDMDFKKTYGPSWATEAA